MTTGKLILKATLLIAFFNLMSKVLGLAREIVIGHLFGARMLTDAYQAALKMPNILFVIISGALATVIVPVFTEYAARGEKKEAWKLFNTVMVVVALLYLAISVIGIAAAPLLVKLAAPGFKGEVASLTVDLVRIILPWMVFAGLASLFAQLLNANNIFGLPAFSNSVNNIIIIVLALIIGKTYGIHGLTAGTLLAMAAMALVQLPALIKSGFRFNFSIDLHHPGVKKIYYLALPSVLAISVIQAPVLINMVLASWLVEGSFSSLNYADKLIQFPVSLFVLALGTAAFPTLARQAAEGDREAFAATVLGSLKVMIAGIIPASVGLMVLCQPIVTLVYKGGKFDDKAVEMTAAALFFYSIGLVGQAAGMYLLSKAFYSLQDTRTPFKLSVITMLINMALSLILIRYLQHAGLALASSLANLSWMALLMVYLWRKVPELRDGGLLKFTLAVLVAAGVMGVTSFTVNAALVGMVSGAVGLALQVGLAIAAGLAAYLLVMVFFAMKVEEVRLFWHAARKVLGRG